MTEPLTIAVCGCGSRARTYMKIAASLDGRYSCVAGADPVKERVEAMREISQNDAFVGFETAEELLAQPKMADVMVIATQDNYHFEPAIEAMKKGYHLLLEKPAAQSMEEVRELERVAKKYNCKVMLCFVLRYTPLYSAVKKELDSGKLGRLISLRTHEGVDPFHQAHSFVRGHWGVASESTPMIVAKCSHDTDILSWMVGSKCRRVSSFGDLTYFNKANAPEGATARCTDGCPYNGKCAYDALQYLDKYERWLDMVFPDPNNRNEESVLEWLKTSKWGRCAYQCDNDVVDHQVMTVEFENGVTASHSMTAFDFGRSIELYGTEASLRGGDAVKENFGCDYVIRYHATREVVKVDLPELDNDGYAGHGGGDYGLMSVLDKAIKGDVESAADIENAVQGHLIAFAAEESRIKGGLPVALSETVAAAKDESNPVLA